MSQVHVRVGFSETGFYDHFESATVIFASPPTGSEITFGIMAYRWNDQGEQIHTGTIGSSLLDIYHKVGHLKWDPKEPNIFQFMDTDSDGESQESGDDDSINGQSSRIDRFLFIAEAKGTLVKQNVEDSDIMTNDGERIPEDPATAAGALQALDTTHHQRAEENQGNPDIRRRLGLGKPPVQVAPPPAMISRSRDELPQHSDRRATSARPQPSLGSFSTPKANVQGAHMILRFFPELHLTNPLTSMVNQLKTLLEAT